MNKIRALKSRLVKAQWTNAFLGILLGVTLAWASPTVFDDLKLTGNDILDSNGTTRITVGSTNSITGNATVSGTLTGNGDVALGSDTDDTITVNGLFTMTVSTEPNGGVTPGAVGQLIWNSTDSELCAATATVASSWVRVSISSVTEACKS